ncbi:MAG: hypothetical protein WCI05_13055 [Myxococcales bacterium]
MNGEHIESILKTAQASMDTEGWWSLPDGGTVTLYVCHGGASLTVSRVEALRTDGELLFGRTIKREVYAFARVDLFAIAVDASAGQPRRAGFS